MSSAPASSSTVPPPYCNEFIDFINYATTSYHAIDYAITKLNSAGFVRLSESEDWSTLLKPSGKYYTIRASSSLIAFVLPSLFFTTSPPPFTILGSHIDAISFKLKPVSNLPSKGGYERLGVAPYSGGGASQQWDGSFSTWWDRDLGIGGRVLVSGKDGKVVEKLVSLNRPVARIPSLAVHFGSPALGPFNYETNFVPIIGLSPPSPSLSPSTTTSSSSSTYGPPSTRHHPHLLKALSRELGISPSSIVDLSLELFDVQPATLLGLSSELIAAPRLDDKLCSFAALHALINSGKEKVKTKGGEVNMVMLFDNEEVGNGLREGAKGNFGQVVIERIVEAQVGIDPDKRSPYTTNLIAQSLSKSLLLSMDVTHAFNPNFASQYLEGASPQLNVGPALKMDSNTRYTTNAVGAAAMRRIADKSGCDIQLFHIRNDSRTGSTLGPVLSERLGVGMAVDMGIPQLSMHSVRAVTGAEDPGLGVKFCEGVFREWGSVRVEMGVE